MNSQRCKIISGGRMQIPADVRKQLGFETGDTVIVNVENNVMQVKSLRESIRRVQEMLKPLRPKPGEMLMSDELIADRRREAENE
jgi:AbrB family looped-hinge helix DNA binding protein